MNFICKILLEMNVTFRGESNNSNQLMIGYSNATVIYYTIKGVLKEATMFAERI